MSEERNQGGLPEARTSSFKVALGVAAVAMGVGLLFCGGVGAYVAWKGPAGESAEVPVPQMPDLFEKQTPAPAIVTIDLPPGFERVSNQGPEAATEQFSPMKSVTFRRTADDGAELMMGRVDLSSIPADISPEKLRGMMLLKLVMAGEINRMFHRTADSVDTKRELTVLGQQVSVDITKGTVESGAKRVTRVVGCFSTQKARIAVIYTIPEDEYDEEGVVRMFESIQPAAGDSVPEAASPPPDDTSGDSADKPAGADPADDDQPESGQTTQPDDQ
jgi:hypothetical protein